MNSLFFFGLLALFRVGFFTGPMYQIISSSNSDLVNQPEEKKEFAKGKPLGLVLENIFKSCPCLLFFFFFFGLSSAWKYSGLRLWQLNFKVSFLISRSKKDIFIIQIFE